jgi:hypothetical protein
VSHPGTSLANHPKTERSRCPVFVIGCHRSGTNLLYDTLLSSGDFAIYRGYLPIYKMLVPRFGRLDKAANRRRMLQTFLRSKGFRRSGLDEAKFTSEVMRDCRTSGDFIRITMDQVAQNQNAARWAVYDPDNALYIREIKRDIPGALFVHIIRDGRDIALSLKKMGGFQPLPWDRGPRRSLLATAMYWEWVVRRGREHGREFPADYTEIHYEDLVSNPRPTLSRLGSFLDHDLDYDRIQSRGLGALRESNSSFREEQANAPIRPMQRWRERLSREDVRALEALVGNCLEATGYELITAKHERSSGFTQKWMRTTYPAFLDTKLWLKRDTPVGRLANLSALELDIDQPSDE